MLMAVFERTREMGVLAALGMKGRQVMGLFLLEGSLIGAVGPSLAAGWACSSSRWLGNVGIDLSKMTTGMGEVGVLMSGKLYPVITAADLLGRAVLVVVIAALASLYPAWQASRKEPSQALHHV